MLSPKNAARKRILFHLRSCDRPVPYDRESASAAGHREADRGILRRLNAKEEQKLLRQERDQLRVSKEKQVKLLRVVYYESIKLELKIRPIYECRCDERLQTKTKIFTGLSYTGLVVELEHLKIKTRLTNENFVSVKGECEI